MLQPLPNVPFGQASRERERRREGREREGGMEGGREGGREGGMEGGREGEEKGEGGRERRLGTCYTKSSLMFDICNMVTSSQVP